MLRGLPTKSAAIYGARAEQLVRSGRRRSHLRRPPTPPYVRFRIRRFIKQAGSVDAVPAVTKDHNDQSKI